MAERRERLHDQQNTLPLYDPTWTPRGDPRLLFQELISDSEEEEKDEEKQEKKERMLYKLHYASYFHLRL